MQPKKYDSFTPKRATNIDGFFAKAANSRPRQPAFRTPAAKPQPAVARLSNMPTRAQQQAVLASADQAATQAQSMHYTPVSDDGPRRRGAAMHEQDTSQEPSKGKKQRSGKRRVLKRAMLIFGALVLLGGGWFGFRFYRDIAKLTGNNNPLSLLQAFVPVPLQNDEGRVNILVAANSADDAGHNGAKLTDSIMVLSLNTKNNTALMLSIPRDLWVNVPGVGHSKINAAYTHGGMNTLQEVVEDTMGLPIHYTALVNYSAFRDGVNAVGGITININSDDPRGIYDSSLDWTTRRCCALAKYPNGPATLNGQQALNLARARGEGRGSYGYAQSDYTRTMYQRKMLLAIKDKAMKPSVIANPFKIADMVDAIGNNVTTNLKLAEVQTLYTHVKKVDDSKIDSYNINTLKGKGTTMLADYLTSDGQQALIPAAGIDNFTDIQRQLNKIFTSDPVSKEGAVAVVLNGTDTPGLAATQQRVLGNKGMTVYIGDASATQATNTIIDNSGGEMPNTLAYLTKQYKATAVADTKLVARYPSADFIVILGQSSVPPSATASTQ